MKFLNSILFVMLTINLMAQTCDNTRVPYPNSSFARASCDGLGGFTVGIFQNATETSTNACADNNKEFAIEVRFKDSGSTPFTPYSINFCMNTESGDLFNYFSDNISIVYEEPQCLQPGGNIGRLVCGKMSFSASEVGSCKSLYFKPPNTSTFADVNQGNTQFSFYDPSFSNYNCNLVGTCGGTVTEVARPLFTNIELVQGSVSQATQNGIFVPDGADLNIDVNYESKGIIILGSLSKIIVESGNTFTKNTSSGVGGAIIRGCTELWESIEVENTGSVVMEGVEVRDGHLGIHILESANLSLKNNAFRDNVHGISSVGFSNGNINMLQFENNKFEGSGSVKPHATLPTPTDRPTAGISLKHTSVKLLSAPDLSKTNRFENLRTGIRSYSGSIGTNFNTFIDCNKAINLSGNGSTDIAISQFNQITNCNEGIRMSQMIAFAGDNNIAAAKTGINMDVLGPLSMMVSDNTITASERGIRSLFNQAGSLTDNTILVDGNITSTVGIDLLLTSNVTIDESAITTDAAASGIHAHLLSGNNTIAENTVTIDQQSIGTKGIYLENSSLNMVTCNFVQGSGNVFTESFGILNENSDNNTLNCNSLSNVEIGIHHQGLMNFIEHTGNEYGDGGVGLMIGRFESNNATIGDQVHRGDNWTGNFSAKAGWNYAGGNLALNSQFHTDENDEGTGDNFWLDPTERVGHPDWFVNVSGTTEICGQGNIPLCAQLGPGNNFTNPNDVIDFIDEVLTADTVLTDNEEWVIVNDAYYWILTQLPPSTWDTQITNFMNDYDDEPQGEFAEIQSLIEEAIAEDVQIATLSEDNANELSDYATTGDGIHLSNIQTNNTQLIPLVAAYESNKTQKLNSALAILQGISPTNNIESDYKVIYEAVLAYLGDPNSTINTALLTPLADQCPTDYPRSVAMSRALLHLDAPQSYNTWDHCAQGTNPRALLSEQSSSLLYPNPTDGLVYFSEVVSDIEVRDITGRLLSRIEKPSQLVDIRLYKAGVYFISYKTNEGMISEKVIKQ